MTKFMFTCVGSKEITRKDGSKIHKNFYLCDPFERGVTGKQCGEFWGPELEPGEVYEGYLGYNRHGQYGLVGLADD